jgi:hypothetical protein
MRTNNRDRDKDLCKEVDAENAENHFRVNFGPKRSSIDQASLIVRFLLRSSWKTDCNILQSKSLGFIMRLPLLMKSGGSLSLLVMNLLSRLLSTITKPIIIIIYAFAMDMTSTQLFSQCIVYRCLLVFFCF